MHGNVWDELSSLSPSAKQLVRLNRLSKTSPLTVEALHFKNSVSCGHVYTMYVLQSLGIFIPLLVSLKSTKFDCSNPISVVSEIFFIPFWLLPCFSLQFPVYRNSSLRLCLEWHWWGKQSRWKRFIFISSIQQLKTAWSCFSWVRKRCLCKAVILRCGWQRGRTNQVVSGAFSKPAKKLLSFPHELTLLCLVSRNK